MSEQSNNGDQRVIGEDQEGQEGQEGQESRDLEIRILRLLQQQRSKDVRETGGGKEERKEYGG